MIINKYITQRMNTVLTSRTKIIVISFGSFKWFRFIKFRLSKVVEIVTTLYKVLILKILKIQPEDIFKYC